MVVVQWRDKETPSIVGEVEFLGHGTLEEFIVLLESDGLDVVGSYDYNGMGMV